MKEYEGKFAPTRTWLLRFIFVALNANYLCADHPLFEAISSHNSELLTNILRDDHDGGLASILNEKGHTPLYAAVMTLFVDGVKILLAAGHDVNGRNADPQLESSFDRTGATPIFHLARSPIQNAASMEIIDILLEHGANPLASFQGQTCLVAAMEVAEITPKKTKSNEIPEYTKALLSHAYTHQDTDSAIIAELFPLYSNVVDFSIFIVRTYHQIPDPLRGYLAAMVADIHHWILNPHAMPSRKQIKHVVGNLLGTVDVRIIFRLVLHYRYLSLQIAAAHDTISRRSSQDSTGKMTSSSASSDDYSARVEIPLTHRALSKLRLRSSDIPRSWNDWSAEEIACGIYAMDRNLFLGFTPTEFFRKYLSQEGDDASIKCFVEFGYRLQKFIATSIVIASMEGNGAKIYKKWAEVAEVLKARRDLFGLAHVLAGVDDRSLTRLDFVKQSSLKKIRSQVESLSRVLDSRRNYSTYRAFITGGFPAYIPMASVESSDITRLKDSSSDYKIGWNCKILNMEKVRGMYELWQNFLRCQEGMRNAEAKAHPMIVDALLNLPSTHENAAEQLSFTIAKPSSFIVEDNLSESPWSEWDADQVFAWFASNSLHSERRLSLLENIVDGKDLLRDQVAWLNERSLPSSDSWRSAVYLEKGLNLPKLSSQMPKIDDTQLFNRFDDEALWLLWLYQNNYSDAEIEAFRNAWGTTAREFYNALIFHDDIDHYLKDDLNVQKLGLRKRLKILYRNFKGHIEKRNSCSKI